MDYRKNYHQCVECSKIHSDSCQFVEIKIAFGSYGAKVFFGTNFILFMPPEGEFFHGCIIYYGTVKIPF